MKHTRHLLDESKDFAAVDLGEMMADGSAESGVVDGHRQQLDWTVGGAAKWAVHQDPSEAADIAVGEAIWCLSEELVSEALTGLLDQREVALETLSKVRPEAKLKEEASHANLLRDIFGNPFRPATLDPAWRTPTVVALAGQMYESRDFTAMPILADALQDAGCDNEDVLDHCRGPGPHVRGCWVVDLVLGKV
jgi:hypothetical protein